MGILSGFKKYKEYLKTDNGYQPISRWTKSDAVIMGDGTDDANTLESAFAQLNSDLALINSNLIDYVALNNTDIITYVDGLQKGTYSFIASNNCTNLPFASANNLFVQKYSNATITVIATTVKNNVSVMYVKNKVNSTWQDWEQVTLNSDLAQQVLIYTNISVKTSSWVSWTPATGFEDYPYVAEITLNGVTANHMPVVSFLPKDANSGNFAPTSVSAENALRIYAKEKPSGTITIQTIQCTRSV